MQLFKSVGMMCCLSLALFVMSCGGNAAHDHGDGEHTHDDATTEAAAHGDGQEYTSAYVCPMHCEGSGSEEAGKCPVCGMDYVALEEHMGDGHVH